MKGFLIFVLGAIVGAVVGVFLLAGMLTGIGAGVGIATGLKAGACLTVEAAKAEGLITSEQVDQVLNAAIRQIAATNIADEAALSASDAACAKVVEDLRAAASQ
jgi:hypothetical protein